MGSSDWNVSMVDIHLWNSCGCTALDMPKWREMTKQIDWREKQPLQVACFSKDLKSCWGAWDTTCGHIAMQRHHTIGCLEERSVERGSARWSSLNYIIERMSLRLRGPSSIRWTLEPFEHERSRQEKEAQGVWVRRQTQFDVVESISHLLIVVSEWTSGHWCVHVTLWECVCVCVCVCVCDVYNIVW